MFNDKQLQLLGYEIDSSRIKTKAKRQDLPNNTNYTTYINSILEKG